jgi:hypothetical protein
MQRDRARNTPQQDGLDTREPARSQHDGRCVNVVGDIADCPPRLPAGEMSASVEADRTSERDTLPQHLLSQLGRDFVGAKRVKLRTTPAPHSTRIIGLPLRDRLPDRL